nr:MAG TPA: hypothetical protein [Bacteriophage sp.]
MSAAIFKAFFAVHMVNSSTSHIALIMMVAVIAIFFWSPLGYPIIGNGPCACFSNFSALSMSFSF